MFGCTRFLMASVTADIFVLSKLRLYLVCGFLLLYIAINRTRVISND